MERLDGLVFTTTGRTPVSGFGRVKKRLDAISGVSEEALFRGLFQTRLVDATARHGWSAHPAILLTALVFGLAHVAGGLDFVPLATLAGIGYGYAYHVTRRIEAAILCHFSVNAARFLLFT